MAATLSLDTITSSGTNIEIPTGKVAKNSRRWRSEDQ